MKQLPGAWACETAQRDPFAAKSTIDGDETRVENGEQNERQNEHEYVVERVEVNQLVSVAGAQLRPTKHIRLPPNESKLISIIIIFCFCLFIFALGSINLEG